MPLRLEPGLSSRRGVSGAPLPVGLTVAGDVTAASTRPVGGRVRGHEGGILAQVEWRNPVGTQRCPVGSGAAAAEWPLCARSLRAAGRKLRDGTPGDPAVVSQDHKWPSEREREGGVIDMN